MGLSEEFGPKILHVKIRWNLHLYHLYHLLTTYQQQITNKNVIFYVKRFGPKLFWYHQLIYYKNHSQNFIKIFFDYPKLSWKDWFIYCSNYLILDWVNFVSLSIDLFIFDLAYIIRTCQILSSNLTYRKLLEMF